MTDDASWLRSLLESRRPDPGPVVGRWALGIGDMVADHPLTSDMLGGLARKLNHFGGVAIGEDAACEVRYHGLLGTREQSDPAVRQCFGATAQAHGVTICPATDDVMADADPRAEQIKSLLATVRAKIDRLTS